MRQSVLIAAPLFTLLVACTESPMAPTPVSQVEIVGMGCGEELDGYRCTATARVDGSTQDVTGLATWSTSDTRIATVNSVGFVTVHAEGEVAIRVEYKGASGALIMRVQPGGLRRYYRALSGFVTDAATGVKLRGVRVEIRNGPNAGRATATGDDGAYQLYDLELGSFVLRFTKEGYTTAERTFNLTGDRFNGLDVSLTLTR